MRYKNREGSLRKGKHVVGGQPIIEPDLIRQRLELAGIQPSPLINEQKIRRSRRIALNRKYKRKRRSSGDDCSS